MTATATAEPAPLPAPPATGGIEIRGLTLEPGGAAGPFSDRLQAVRDLDADIAPGELGCLLGPSGCGKTSLLSALAGFLAPSAGTLSVAGVAVRGPDPRIGMVFQQSSLLPWRTVEDNVAFGLKMRGVKKAERRGAARDLLSLVGLQGFERHFPDQLSGGMRQRVEIARVLINQPRVVLMDEPFAALDAQTRLMMQELLLEVWGRVRTTILFVTHDIDEAIFLGDRILVMTGRPGRIREVIPIDLPRPRSIALSTTPRFVELKRQCLELVRQESLKTMSGRT
jgi:NitT/TauT family transport system ATP-binding protein